MLFQSEGGEDADHQNNESYNAALELQKEQQLDHTFAPGAKSDEE